MARRLELTVSDETWERLNAVRGHEPRASFAKRGLVMLIEVMSEGASPTPVARLTSEDPIVDTASGPKPLSQVRQKPPSRLASKPFRCPIYDCVFESGSTAAVCGKHGRKVIPAG